MKTPCQLRRPSGDQVVFFNLFIDLGRREGAELLLKGPLRPPKGFQTVFLIGSWIWGQGC